MSDKVAYRWVKDDPCTNMGVSAWKLRTHLNETQSLSLSIKEYGEGPFEKDGTVYRNEVVAAMRAKGLLRQSSFEENHK